VTDQTISIQTVNQIIRRNYPLWRLVGTFAQMDAIDMSGTLSGTVKEAGILQADALVSVYYRRNGNFIARVRTDINGAWSVSGLDKSVADYYAVAQTENSYNAIIYDKLTPV
jgi:hypothetical protein